MNEKIKVSRQAVKAIKTLRSYDASNFQIVTAAMFVSRPPVTWDPIGSVEALSVLRESFANVDEMYTALLGYYEVEQSIDEIIVKYHKDARHASYHAGDTSEERARAKGRAEAIEYFAKLWEIELPGIYEK